MMVGNSEMANGDILGEQKYQKSAGKALPVLVKQVELRTEISYSALADEIGMPNPRNLNHVLECIGLRLGELSDKWGETIPPIQTVVINKGTGLPSEGVGWLLKGRAREEFDARSIKERRRLLRTKWADIYDYQRWPDVLKAVGLKPLGSEATDIVRTAAQFDASGESRGSFFGSNGESAAHRNLKSYVAQHPEIINIPANAGTGVTEMKLPSGDRLDVFFKSGQDCIAVEVKSLLSTIEDVTRGIFQCVKYCAVIEAQQASDGVPQSGRAILVLEGELPAKLIGLRNRLGIEIREKIVPK
jgi:hypothetical protein